jgi:TldD protein
MYKQLAEKGLEYAAKLGASYADIRFVEIEQRLVETRNSIPDNISHTSESGVGVRLIVEKGWGFAGSYKTGEKDLRATIEKAIKIAKASSSIAKKPIKLAPTKIVEDSFSSKYKEDPTQVALEDILERLISADKAYREVSPHVRTTSNSMVAKKEEKFLATSEGSRITQKIIYCGTDGEGWVMDKGLLQRRSYAVPPLTKGYEYIKDHDLDSMAKKAGTEAEMLLKAEACPTEIRTNLILDDNHITLQIHETIGHATELDRVLGTEIDMAGMSFLTPDKLGKFQYASKYVSFATDSVIPDGLGTYGYDDEGVPAKKQYLVKDGIFVGYQSSRETAAQIGLKESSAGMRAVKPIDIPIIRMNNIYLEPGDWKAKEIIEDTKDGILMRSTTLWSVDQKRLNFQFGCEIGWIIKNGELTKVIRDPTYTALSYEFWRNLDATAKDDWKLYGTPSCGKGKPGQLAHTGHGGATMRVKDVRIGITGKM